MIIAGESGPTGSSREGRRQDPTLCRTLARRAFTRGSFDSARTTHQGFAARIEAQCPKGRIHQRLRRSAPTMSSDRGTSSALWIEIRVSKLGLYSPRSRRPITLRCKPASKARVSWLTSRCSRRSRISSPRYVFKCFAATVKLSSLTTIVSTHYSVQRNHALAMAERYATTHAEGNLPAP